MGISRYLDVSSVSSMWLNDTIQFPPRTYALPCHGFWPDFQNQAGIPVYGADLKSSERTIGYHLNNNTAIAHVCPSAWQAGLWNCAFGQNVISPSVAQHPGDYETTRWGGSLQLSSGWFLCLYTSCMCGVFCNRATKKNRKSLYCFGGFWDLLGQQCNKKHSSIGTGALAL